MSRCLERLALALVVAASASAVLAEPMGLGRPATSAEVAAWDIDIRPDGAGLPKGRGSVAEGEEVFAEQCAICHGDFGEGVDRWPVLAGGVDTLASDDPVKTIGSYWPYLSTVWDYVHRAMPFGNAQSLTDDEVYGITAYLLYVNDIVEDEDFVLSDENLATTRLPNQNGFFMDDRAESPLFAAREVCMRDCKDDVRITMRARVLDVTPEETAAVEVEAEVETEVAATTAELDPELVAAGKKVFRKCKACHQMGEGARNKTGPVLTDILNAGVGAVEGFRYSTAFKTAAADGMVWDAATLDAFLRKPKAVIPKTKMSFRGLKKDADRAAVIAYLKANGG